MSYQWLELFTLFLTKIIGTKIKKWKMERKIWNKVKKKAPQWITLYCVFTLDYQDKLCWPLSNQWNPLIIFTPNIENILYSERDSASIIEYGLRGGGAQDENPACMYPPPHMVVPSFIWYNPETSIENDKITNLSHNVYQ